MTDLKDELIKEVALHHGIALGRDDPILILQTLNNHLMEHNVKSQEKLLSQFREEMEALTDRAALNSKENAERILNAALSASKEAMAQLLKGGSVHAITKLKTEIEVLLTQVSLAQKKSERCSLLNTIAACLIFSGACIMAIVFLF